ncbi:hypothetical protein VMCG_05824 [Cytospora schulzeri]|uniref:Uncharacterized protein n=1 Tax=Cytospora schulzeri TaxID=448051 RepID=A0A423WI76_9PEZI|nr:hypothetical protein VMCG_05824 [Valsa malicola]
MSSELPGAFPSEDVVVKNTEGSSLQQPTTATTTTGAGQSTQTGAWSDSTSAATTDAPDITEDIKRFAEGAMTAAAAVGLAAKDAALAAKDAALPVAKDAAVAAKENAVPAANVASEKVMNAAAYTRDSAVDMASTARDSAVDMAGTARENAPSVLPGTDNTNTTSHNPFSGSIDETSTGIPTEVRDSILKSGQGPEAAGDWQAVQDKSRMENELLSSVSRTQAGSGEGSRSQNQGTGAIGATPGNRSEAHRPNLYSQDTGSYQTPGTAVVLGTNTERAFPLGGEHSHEHEPRSTHTSTSLPDFAETPAVTTGLETRQTAETSTPTGRGDYTHENGARSHAQNVGSGFGSTEDRIPKTSNNGGPVLADLPLREIEAPTAGVQMDGGAPTSHSQRDTPITDKVPVRESEEATGSGGYKTLGSGTPSGVRV